jgi:palmitoyltransferase
MSQSAGAVHLSDIDVTAQAHPPAKTTVSLDMDESAAHLTQQDEAEASVPLLHTYSQQGDFEQAKALLDAGHDAGDRDSEGITALHWASMNMHIPICKLLLERGAEIDPIGGQLQATPLHWAAR